MDSELIENTEIQNIPQTQNEESGKSKLKYSWVILFHFDINVSTPFVIYKLRDFLDTEFPWNVITGELSQESRIKLFEFSCMPGKKFFIFAKVQYGK